MLALVVPDRDLVGLVEEDVAGHEHRVREEPGAHGLLLLRLLLELRHAAQLAHRRDGAQKPRGFRVGRDVALDEHRRAVRIQARSEQHRGQIEGPLAQILGVVRHRDRVQIDDAEEPDTALLRQRVLAKAAAEVPEVLGAGRLDAGEDSHEPPDYRELD